MSLSAPVVRHDHQPCAGCGINCLFHVVDAPRPDVPSFLTPIFPDQCWVGWAWSTEVPSKLVLIAFCSQTCLVHWFEDREAPDGAQ